MSKLSDLLESLQSTPKILGQIAENFSKEKARRRGKNGGFSLVENVWHMADLEREGYGVRIQRITSSILRSRTSRETAWRRRGSTRIEVWPREWRCSIGPARTIWELCGRSLKRSGREVGRRQTWGR